jgi:sugar/nucleoside kinase (ribokinase family)
MCDPNVRPRRWDDEDEMLRVIRALVAAATVVKCNEGEVLTLGGGTDVEVAARAVLKSGPAAVVVTLGERGALVVSEAGTQSVKGVEAEVVDATGAGDSVAGVITAGLAAGADPLALAPVAEIAMRAAAAVVGTWGATAGLPPASGARAQLAAALAN